MIPITENPRITIVGLALTGKKKKVNRLHWACMLPNAMTNIMTVNIIDPAK